MERQCLDEMLTHSIAGHTIDPDSFLREGVLNFDKRAAGNKTVRVNHLHIADVNNFC